MWIEGCILGTCIGNRILDVGYLWRWQNSRSWKVVQWSVYLCLVASVYMSACVCVCMCGLRVTLTRKWTGQQCGILKQVSAKIGKV